MCNSMKHVRKQNKSNQAIQVRFEFDDFMSDFDGEVHEAVICYDCLEKMGITKHQIKELFSRSEHGERIYTENVEQYLRGHVKNSVLLDTMDEEDRVKEERYYKSETQIIN